MLRFMTDLKETKRKKVLVGTTTAGSTEDTAKVVKLVNCIAWLAWHSRSQSAAEFVCFYRILWKRFDLLKAVYLVIFLLWKPRFHCHAIIRHKKKIGNRLKEEAKKMKCYKLIYKQFVQVSSLCGSQFPSYLPKHFTDHCRRPCKFIELVLLGGN